MNLRVALITLLALVPGTTGSEHSVGPLPPPADYDKDVVLAANLGPLIGSAAWSVETVNDITVALDIDAPETLTSLGPQLGTGGGGYSAGASAFPTGSFVYQLDANNYFAKVDKVTGAHTVLTSPIPPNGGEWAGLEMDSTTGVLYGISIVFGVENFLSIIDPSTSAVTPIGPVGGPGGAIALAIDGSSNGFFYDIFDDNFYSVDLDTGNTTLIGSIGFDANYGQGMAYDPASDQIYMAAFNNNLFRAEMRTVDTATGATTLVGVIGSNDPGGTVQLGWLAIEQDTPSGRPSDTPSTTPSDQPTSRPSSRPSSGPSTVPSVQPSSSPSAVPSTAPSERPSYHPTAAPILPHCVFRPRSKIKANGANDDETCIESGEAICRNDWMFGIDNNGLKLWYKFHEVEIDVLSLGIKDFSRGAVSLCINERSDDEVYLYVIYKDGITYLKCPGEGNEDLPQLKIVAEADDLSPHSYHQETVVKFREVSYRHLLEISNHGNIKFRNTVCEWVEM